MKAVDINTHRSFYEEILQICSGNKRHDSLLGFNAPQQIFFIFHFYLKEYCITISVSHSYYVWNPEYPWTRAYGFTALCGSLAMMKLCHRATVDIMAMATNLLNKVKEKRMSSQTMGQIRLHDLHGTAEKHQSQGFHVYFCFNYLITLFCVWKCQNPRNNMS